ncbi:hypothetical protein BWZ20_13610 [Winogradskyella sp. J14-2]|uniref:hypothetical protein n=1 Tax=Winogradskyella sp. J14-2 TaxID=1936080 RepID=UPI000972DBA4|nr:hypothetical protein [Winogradskyella sp. J14-2]APY09274.1 hypothetical protein BWZ20_13610 [Winogradskyella sp. J14-2]
MQLYKSRSFGEYFQDTFSFLRQNGKHLYKNFFIINGIFILILLVLGYFFSNFYTEVVFGGLTNNNTNAIEDYMNQNATTVVVFVLLFVTIGLVSAVISYAFVPIYLKLYAKNDGKHFNASDIITEYKANTGNIIIYLLCAILVAIPILIIAGIVSFVLAITIIGFLLLPLVLGAVSLFYQGTLMEYIENKKSIWASFGYSWTLMSSKFWAAIGCVGLFFLMSYIVQNIIVMIPYFIFIVDMFTNIESGTVATSQEISKSATVMLVLIFLLSYLLGLFLNIIVQINQGIVFYSLKEDAENINTKSDIDFIGSGE